MLALLLRDRMPLIKWQVEPSRLLESSAATQQGSELNDFINVMMTSVIRQLSCVCRYADAVSYTHLTLPTIYSV